jgi:hypothetical protein
LQTPFKADETKFVKNLIALLFEFITLRIDLQGVGKAGSYASITTRYISVL